VVSNLLQLTSEQLLRLKCQAYSTLSDSDEDGPAEARLTERMSHTVSGALPPHANLVAPAALYLTAILEYVYHLSSCATLVDQVPFYCRSVCEYVGFH
jgi:hypothetical protein